MEKYLTENGYMEIKEIWGNKIYDEKEQEWIKLVGKAKWYALDKEKRDFLIRTAGAINLGQIDIKKVYKLNN